MTMATSDFPVSFSGLLGQSQAKELLARSIRSRRLAHGYLFRGPDGVGKSLFARSLAASVNCRSREGIDACGSCSSCRKYSSANHPDFMVISPEKGTIRIDTIREMKKSLSYPPYESIMRVVLLEDIHTMRQEAANSLLKSLEEPPDNNLLILTAESSRDVLATIISRCQVVPFYSLTLEQTQQVLQEDDPQLNDKRARLLARLSEGSPGKALFFKQTEIVDILEKVVTVIAEPVYSSDDHIGHVLEVAGRMAEFKEHLASFLGLLRIWVKDLLLVSTSQHERISFDFSGQTAGDKQWRRWNREQLFSKLSAIDQAEKELDRNCNRLMVCEVLLFKLQA